MKPTGNKPWLVFFSSIMNVQHHIIMGVKYPYDELDNI